MVPHGDSSGVGDAAIRRGLGGRWWDSSRWCGVVWCGVVWCGVVWCRVCDVATVTGTGTGAGVVW